MAVKWELSDGNLLYFHHIFSYCCLLHRSYVHVTKAVLTSWSISIGVLLHLGTDEDTLYSHMYMYRNLNQCRFEGVGFTNTPASKHLINYQIPIRRLTKLQLQHLAILNYYMPNVTNSRQGRNYISTNI